MESQGEEGDLSLEYYVTPSYDKAMAYIQYGAKGTNYR
jgi:hypothetical protein